MPNHYLNQCWVIVNWTQRNKLQWNCNQNTKFFIHENASENIVCKMAAILSRVRWINKQLPSLYQISMMCHEYSSMPPVTEFCLPCPGLKYPVSEGLIGLKLVILVIWVADTTQFGLPCEPSFCRTQTFLLDFASMTAQQTLTIMTQFTYVSLATIPIHVYSLLTHWGWDKMAAILEMTFSSTCPGMKNSEFEIKFRWNMFPRVQLTILQHWSR